MIQDVRGREISVAQGSGKLGEFEVKIYKASRLVLRLDRANATRFAGHLEGLNSVTLEDTYLCKVFVSCAGRWVYVDKQGQQSRGQRNVFNLRSGPAQDLALEVWKVLGVVHSSA